jgi:eukaryotic-like serine/threonine-protein kinase
VADRSRVQELLDEIWDSGRPPEEVCSDCPEMLPEVRQRWLEMLEVEAELDALFPTTGPDPDAERATPWKGGADLPRISGYEVEELLGRGGMGVVYKARHLRLNRFVALKMLIGGAYAAPRERARFQREAEAVASLRHPNIVSVYDVGDHEGWPYFTMELLEGGSLAQGLAGTPQPARHAAEVLTTLAEAVQAAHSAGIVHRDLKPANILLTPTGTPKVADFGLARHFDGEPGITQSGARLGTPSYMAPEQASGKVGTIGPAADIYSLGALLYEMLTGRPPFRGETRSETERQVIAVDPVPPSRLNGKVPRDLETICLKCLHKAPERRYATAGALAEDLKRFQHNEPIAARRAGLLERSGKWVRRHPTPAVALAAGLALAIMLVGVSFWLAVQQAHRRVAVDADLKELTAMQEIARWQVARAALERAELRLEWGVPDDLRRRLGQARRDLEFVIELDSIRLKRVTRGELSFYKMRASREYADALQRAGLGTVDDQPSRVARMIRASQVRASLLAAVYDWALCAADKKQRAWLLEVARLTDSSSSGWRERALDSAEWEELRALNELARTAPVGHEAVPLLLALGERLRAVHGPAAPFLRRVQQEHPADFWANLILGNAVLQASPQEAISYYRAALASRPNAAVGYCAVGDALKLQNSPDQAIDYYKKALELDPGFVRAYSNVGDALQVEGQWDEALDYYRKALELDADYAWAHHNLANALQVKGGLDEALLHYQQAIRLDPDNWQVQNGIRSILLRQGRGTEVQVEWRKLLDGNPREYEAWSGYAELCLFLGQEEEFRRACRALFERFGTTTSPYIAEPVARAWLLLPGPADEQAKAASLADRAVAAKSSTPEWIYRYFLFAKGLADYRQGRFASAISLMEGEASTVMGPSPSLVVAMAQHKGGQREQARKTLATAIVGFDWSAAQADSRGVWIAHILRREAEALIVPNLPAFLRGEYRPLDNDERLALVGACEFQGRPLAVARLFAEAFATDPALANELIATCRARAVLGEQRPVSRVEDLATECRYPAARCAALAGCGGGEDGAKLSNAERARWRKQAREWLRADLAVWAKMLESGSLATRVVVGKILMHWQSAPDLAGLREQGALDRLPADEQEECLELWKQVAAVLDGAGRVQ